MARAPLYTPAQKSMTGTWRTQGWRAGRDGDPCEPSFPEADSERRRMWVEGWHAGSAERARVEKEAR